MANIDGPRACRALEFDQVIGLINRVFRAGTDQDIRTDYPLVFDRSQLANMRVVTVDGDVVSQVPVAPRQVIAEGARFTVGIISPTVTDPDHRRRGYATRCLRDCIAVMDEQRWPVSVLWTVEPTLPFYQHSLWEAVASQGWVYELTPADQRLFGPGQFEVACLDPANAGHLDAIIDMHEAEGARIERTRGQYEVLFGLPKTQTLLATSGSRIVAYLMVGNGVNKPGIIEAGGAQDGLAALVASVLSQRSDPVQALVPLTDCALSRSLQACLPGRRRPVEQAAGVGHQMMRVNCLETLLRQCQGHLNQKAGQITGQLCLVTAETDEAVTLELANGKVGLSRNRLPQAIVLGRRQLAQLVFGPHPGSEPLDLAGSAARIVRALFPLYFPVWELDHS